MGFQTLLVTNEAGVTTITLNRPDSYNAFNAEMIGELLEVLQQANVDERTRAVVITGAGKAFCGGGDVKTFLAGLLDAGAAEVEAQVRFPNRIPTILKRLEKPTIAAVNGVAAGGGFSICLACDIRIASTEARFAAAYVKRGLSGADMGTTWFLPRLVGLGKASEILLTGATIDAAEARRIGLVTRVVEPGELNAVAGELARQLATGPTAALRMTKQAIEASLVSDFDVALEHEVITQIGCVRTEDFREGIQSFLEKRTPVFKGR